MNQEFFSVLVQVVAALGLAGIILLLSILMGKRSSVRKPADIPYECGMIPMGEGAPMFSVKFYMVAMLFVIFDLEVVFLYPWAVNFRDYVMMNPGILHGHVHLHRHSAGGLPVRAGKGALNCTTIPADPSLFHFIKRRAPSGTRRFSCGRKGTTLGNPMAGKNPLKAYSLPLCLFCG